jgi:hypothetical protein
MQNKKNVTQGADTFKKVSNILKKFIINYKGHSDKKNYISCLLFQRLTQRTARPRHPIRDNFSIHLIEAVT